VGVCEDAASAPPDAVTGVAGDEELDEEVTTARGVLAWVPDKGEAEGEGESSSTLSGEEVDSADWVLAATRAVVEEEDKDWATTRVERGSSSVSDEEDEEGDATTAWVAGFCDSEEEDSSDSIALIVNWGDMLEVEPRTRR